MTRYRESVRSLLRDRLLDAAYERVTADGWSKLRMAHIATTAGVSRQTVYTEFGTRDAIGQALVMREVDRFLLGVQEQLDAHRPDPRAAVEAAVRFTLDTAADNPLVKSVLTSSRGAEDDLLAHLTTRSEPLLETATTMLDAYAAEAWPHIDADSRALAVETVVRLTVSHLVQPTLPPSTTAARLARVLSRVALLPDPS
ncbi:TetR family transcriptional regulator [Actinocorallia sp. A-T 12471]|uniref:TetR family transcriptional regulator n=1 Tax=Actinocorallia sp. A-T 12471 TaxID=3089813 RepID=UPI0029CE900C|nr:TetR family transcriptional regulator [Actinocorallia sp. A-T 12471]MDX6739552.1 TetR family transcriptional regulator [Actinocorallia sp. A-T 12471]